MSLHAHQQDKLGKEDWRVLRCAADDIRVSLSEHMELCRAEYDMEYKHVQRVNELAHQIVELLAPIEVED